MTGCFFLDWPAGDISERALASDLGRVHDGMLQEYRVFPERALVKTPQHLSDVEAATLPCAALTAWSAIVTQGFIKPGQSILTQGTGGVSLFALQLGVILGARVIVTSSSDEKLERVKAMGAHATINYRSNEDWGVEGKKIAGGDGVDLVMELGGTQTLKQSLSAVRPGGTLSMIGVLSGATFGDILLPFIVTRNVRLQGITVGAHDGMVDMCRAIETHGLKPVVDKTFPLADAAEAFKHLQSGTHFGKVCVEI